jgi:uncharacterized protein (DUF3820 family)
MDRSGVAMIISFGKFKGEQVQFLPDDYLWWLFGQDFLKPPLAEVVKSEVSMRWPGKFEIFLKQPRQRASKTKKKPPELAAIKSIFRELALKFHPDTGGNTAAMAALNEFYERLQTIK